MKTRTVTDCVAPICDVHVSDIWGKPTVALWMNELGSPTVSAHLTVKQAKQVVKNLKRAVKNLKRVIRKVESREGN